MTLGRSRWASHLGIRTLLDVVDHPRCRSAKSLRKRFRDMHGTREPVVHKNVVGVGNRLGSPHRIGEPVGHLGGVTDPACGRILRNQSITCRLVTKVGTPFNRYMYGTPPAM